MATARIKARMTNWPPHTVLVHLDEPITYYDRETGDRCECLYVAVNSRHPDIHSADHARIDVYPCDEEGGFVEHDMIPIRKWEFERITTALQKRGYDVVDEDNLLMLLPAG